MLHLTLSLPFFLGIQLDHLPRMLYLPLPGDVGPGDVGPGAILPQAQLLDPHLVQYLRHFLTERCGEEEKLTQVQG